jgi:hypothetical protein
MAKSKVAARVWNKTEEKLMVKLVKAGTPTSAIAKKLKRSAASIRSKAQKQSLSLKLKPRARRR